MINNDQRTNGNAAVLPIILSAADSKSIRQIILELIDSAIERQRECSGNTVVGAVLEHLVGAKLSLALPTVDVSHKSFTSADAPSQAKGDFLVGDTAIHVTVAPAVALVRKCRLNLEEGLHPLVVTTESGVGGILALAVNERVADRIDVLEISQFLATTVYEWTGFRNQERTVTLARLIETYNGIIDSCETDPSLKIAMG